MCLSEEVGKGTMKGTMKDGYIKGCLVARKNIIEQFEAFILSTKLFSLPNIYSSSLTHSKKSLTCLCSTPLPAVLYPLLPALYALQAGSRCASPTSSTLTPSVLIPYAFFSPYVSYSAGLTSLIRKARYKHTATTQR